MKTIIAYQLSWLGLLSFLWFIELRGLFPEWFTVGLPFHCALMGLLGGLVYCLRSVYLNRCVNNQWDNNWHVWYYLRPIVSLLVGGVSYVFLKAGLLILGAQSMNAASPYGFLALSFIAGLNVDRFIIKLEKTAEIVWGVKPSRTSETSSNSDKGKEN